MSKKKRLKEFEKHVEHWRDLLGITSFDLYVELERAEEALVVRLCRLL